MCSSLTRISFVIVLALAFCAGCGLKGDLYLPEEPSPEVATDSDDDAKQDE